MRAIADLSISRKLILIVMTATVLAIVLSAPLFLAYEWHISHETALEEAETLAGIVANSITASIVFNSPDDAHEVLVAMRASENLLYVCIHDRDGATFAKYSPAKQEYEIPEDAATVTAHRIDQALTVSKEVVLDGERIGTAFVTLDLRPVDARLKKYALTMLGILVLVLTVAYLVTRRLQRFVSDPILHLAQVARSVSADRDYSIRVEPFAKDETGVLYTTFNMMLSRIERANSSLEEANEALEERVKARTIELENEVAERIRAEEAVREAQEILTAAIEHTPAGVIIADAPDVRIRVANSAALGIRGGSADVLTDIPAELHPRHWQTLHPDGTPFTEQELPLTRAILEGVTSVNVEAIIIRTDGERRWVSANAAPVRNAAGEIVGGIVVFPDITESKQFQERQWELQEKLERAERMESLGLLAGGVAHDLNNMLGPLVGYPELLLRRMDPESKEARQVKIMASSARDAADVIQDLLTLARRGRYELEPTLINTVIEQYLESPSFQKFTENRGDVAVEIDLDRTIGFIQGSAPHLSKVIMNFVVNAMDAMPDGGRLRIKTIQETISTLRSGHDRIEAGEYIIVTVTDTGMGIAKENIDRIFEPYFSKKKMGTSGSGLGLSVVYGIVKDHNGYYDVFSEVGVGTEFVIYLPVSHQAPKNDDHQDELAGGTETVLVVDDVANQRQLACDMLESLGYTVHRACNGTEAVKFMRGNQVDLVLLDMIMEDGFDGLDTYREIAKIHPNQKAVIASGFSQTGRVEEVLSLGAGLYLRKPYKLEQLAGAVREVLDLTPAPNAAST